MTVVAIIQARMSSSRLPGKVLMPIAGRPAIALMVERVRRARRIDAVCVATSDDPSDDPLARELDTRGITVFRGSLDDVLARFVGAMRWRDADIAVRLTGDCPLIDPGVIDRVVDELVGGGYDYVSNVDPPTFPDGLDVEAATRAAFERADEHAKLQWEREHVTQYLRNTAGFARGQVACALDMSSLRWTVDYADDLALVRAMADACADPVAADMFDLLRAYEAVRGPKPSHVRNEGLQASITIEDADRG